MQLLKPRKLPHNATIGIFTPSNPAYTWAENVYKHALSSLNSLGFTTIEGSLTKSRSSQGYRSGTPQDRASEFMELIHNSDVDCLMATIGGFNSSSLIPYLDFEAIREARKIICGYSDITSLHMAILHYSKLSTFYGPAVVTSFGEYPQILDYTLESFTTAAKDHDTRERLLTPPKHWSNHRRDWTDGSWKKGQRQFQPNEGWKTLVPGQAQASLIACNLNTLTAIAGTDYFPDCQGKILLLEEEQAPFAIEERSLRQLSQIGVFDSLEGLIIGKAEQPDTQSAPFSFDELLSEVLPKKCPYPVITNFDCGHTHPMITLAQGTLIRMRADGNRSLELRICEAMVSE